MARTISFIIVIIILIFFLLYCSTDDDGHIQDVSALNVHDIGFADIDTTEPDSLRTLRSLKKEGELYLITYYGDYSALLEELNEKIITVGMDSVAPRYELGFECSIFAAAGDPAHPLFGRNFDNDVERGVAAGLYSPPDGYRSIALSRMSDVGFDRHQDPTLLPVEDRRQLLNSVFFPNDGMNEQGVSIALATGENTTLIRNENKKLIFITYLLREVLDHSANVAEAVEIVKKYDVFDLNTSTISNHLLISAPAGESVIAEYDRGEWRFMYNVRPWQIVTNIPLFNKSEEEARNECWRYKTADDFLHGVQGRIGWQDGMNILQSISTADTQWSSLYDMNTKEIYISLYRNFDDIFLLKIK